MSYNFGLASAYLVIALLSLFFVIRLTTMQTKSKTVRISALVLWSLAATLRSITYFFNGLGTLPATLSIAVSILDWLSPTLLFLAVGASILAFCHLIMENRTKSKHKDLKKEIGNTEPSSWPPPPTIQPPTP